MIQILKTKANIIPRFARTVTSLKHCVLLQGQTGLQLNFGFTVRCTTLDCVPSFFETVFSSTDEVHNIYFLSMYLAQGCCTANTYGIIFLCQSWHIVGTHECPLPSSFLCCLNKINSLDFKFAPVIVNQQLLASDTILRIGKATPEKLHFWIKDVILFLCFLGTGLKSPELLPDRDGATGCQPS